MGKKLKIEPKKTSIQCMSPTVLFAVMGLEQNKFKQKNRRYLLDLSQMGQAFF